MLFALYETKNPFRRHHLLQRQIWELKKAKAVEMRDFSHTYPSGKLTY